MTRLTKFEELRIKMNVSEEELLKARKELSKWIKLYENFMSLPKNVFVVDIRRD